jgi:hypothetical protein
LEKLQKFAQPDKWFGNEIIDTYLALLIARHPSLGHLPSHIFYLFKNNNLIQTNWAEQIDLEQTSMYFIPLHINGNGKNSFWQKIIL